MKQLFPSAVSPHEANRSFMLPGLDGLRAIAVLLVIVYHLWPTSVPGGMIGVDIFFVISGVSAYSFSGSAALAGSFPRSRCLF